MVFFPGKWGCTSQSYFYATLKNMCKELKKKIKVKNSKDTQGAV